MEFIVALVELILVLFVLRAWGQYHPFHCVMSRDERK